MRVLDLFSGACGGWSLGLHRAGLSTVAACEADEWRRRKFAYNFPEAFLYDDVRTLTAERLKADGIYPIELVCGSPPCQDASTANSKGRGIDGERTGLYLEAVRIVLEVRPRWYAFENVPGIRSRGIDRVLGKLEQGGYAAWPLVVGAHDLGAPHIRQRSWVIGADATTVQRLALPWDQPDRNSERTASYADSESEQCVAEHGEVARQSGVGDVADPREGGRREIVSDLQPGKSHLEGRASAHANGQRVREQQLPGRSVEEAPEPAQLASTDGASDGRRPRWSRRSGSGASRQQDQLGARDAADASGAGRESGRIRCAELGSVSASDTGRSRSGSEGIELAIAGRVGSIAETWNGGIAGRIRMDDGLPKGMAKPLLAAYGDSVVPQIAEIIGRAIMTAEGLA